MPDPTLATALAQFGVAGLIGWMWLAERRAAQSRERQLDEAHQRLIAERAGQQILIDLVTTNTRALTSLEAQQRELARVLDRLILPTRPPAPPDPRPR